MEYLFYHECGLINREIYYENGVEVLRRSSLYIKKIEIVFFHVTYSKKSFQQ
jgi:hypothetical protein